VRSGGTVRVGIGSPLLMPPHYNICLTHSNENLGFAAVAGVAIPGEKRESEERGEMRVLRSWLERRRRRGEGRRFQRCVERGVCPTCRRPIENAREQIVGSCLVRSGWRCAACGFLTWPADASPS
jgi:hypothetical protein